MRRTRTREGSRWRQSVVGAATLPLLLLTISCQDPHPWSEPSTIVVPPATPTLSREPVDAAARVPLITGEEPEVVVPPMIDGSPSFGRAARLALDQAGNIYVADTLESNIKVFDANGARLRAFGRRGQGPEEFSRFIRALAVAGDWVAVSDLGHRRLSIWTLAGEFVKTLPLIGEEPGEGRIGGFWELGGFSGRQVVGQYSDHDASEAEFERVRIALLDLESGKSQVLVDVPRRRAHAAGADGRRLPVPMLGPEPQFAANRCGLLYATAAESYEIVAFQRALPRWRLRVPWPRLEMPDMEYDRAMAGLRSMPGGGGRAISVQRSQIVSFAELPAVSTIRVDDSGRLYVFPLIYYTLGRLDTLPEQVPVDVYSPDGSHLVAGLLPARFGVHRDQSGSWLSSHSGYIYGIETDWATQEQQVVRYKVPALP